jgi:DNA modification methylase
MDIINIEIDKLKPAKYNPRKNLKVGDAEYEKIKNSIIKYGLIQPFIINKDFTVIAGHQRLTVIKDLGYTMAGCIKVDLNKKEEKKLNLAMNKITGQWDENKLTELLKDLNNDYDSIGFDTEEINNLLAEAENVLKNKNITKEKKEEKFDVDKELEKIEEPTVMAGDTYKLGKHLLMCGDSFNIDQVNKLIGDNIIDMMFTDPPYKMRSGGSGCFKERTKNMKKRIENLIDFKVSDISHFVGLDINTFYIFTSKDNIRDYLNLFKHYNFNLLTWNKTNPTPWTNGTFLPDMEYILYFSTKDKIWNNNLKPTEIYKKYYTCKKEDGRKDSGDLHPTMKPLELISNRILISSNKDGYVLDLFGGSGSTLISCEQTERRCLMMEIDNLYCDVIIKRYESFTGNKAKKMG